MHLQELGIMKQKEASLQHTAKQMEDTLTYKLATAEASMAAQQQVRPAAWVWCCCRTMSIMMT